MSRCWWRRRPLRFVRARARAGFTERESYVLERGAERSADWNAIAAAASNRSLFAERRIIEIRLASCRPGVSGAATLTQLAQMRAADVLVLVISPRLDREAQNAPWVQALQSAGAWLAIWPVGAQDLVAFLGARARRLGLNLDDEALELLAARTEGNLLAAQQELEKLRLLFDDATITAQQVLASVGDSARYDVAQLGAAALAGDTARALAGARGAALRRRRADAGALGAQ